MTAIINGIQYIGGQTSPDEFIKNQAGEVCPPIYWIPFIIAVIILLKN